MPTMNMAHKIDMSKIKDKMPNSGAATDSADITNPFEGLPQDGIKYLEKKTVDGKEVQVFEAVMPFAGQMSADQPGNQMMPKKMNILIAADSGLPYKIIAYSQNDTLMMQQTYSNFRTNIPIDDSEFEFTPPEGVQVMDMTEGAINMMQQMQGSDTKVE
jgi:outer membrane lipoprotein-sorting protein